MPVKPNNKTEEDYVKVAQGTDGEMVGTIDPLFLVAMALTRVAKGDSVVELRRAVVQSAPPHDDIEARKVYVTQLKRMRDAADVALTLAQELASGV